MTEKKISPELIQQYFDAFSEHAHFDVASTREEAAELLFSAVLELQQRRVAYIIDLAAQSITQISGIEQLLGFDSSSFDLHKLHQQIHPDDIENVMNATCEAFAHIAEKQETHPLAAQLSLTYRMRHADGHYLHIQDNILILSTSVEGHPIKALATITDLSPLPFEKFTGHLSCPCNGFQTEFTSIRQESEIQKQNIEKFGFTKREIEIINLLRKGKSSEEIAGELFISRHTVDKHRSNILDKAGMSRTLQLLSFLS
jgi:DNA-binding CsgD family transcriptional regulator